MTPILKPIAESFRTTNSILDLCLRDLNDEDAKKRIRNGEAPSIAWQAGHILHHRWKVLELLGGAEVRGASDGSDYPDLPDFRRQWEQVFAELEAAMDAASPESLDRIVERGPHGTKTALESIVFLAWHEAYHTGAVGSIRKQLVLLGHKRCCYCR